MAETAAINHFAAQYVAEYGGDAALTDCAARPAPREDIWIVITCAPPGQTVRATYAIDRAWRLRDPANLHEEKRPEA